MKFPSIFGILSPNSSPPFSSPIHPLFPTPPLPTHPTLHPYHPESNSFHNKIAGKNNLPGHLVTIYNELEVNSTGYITKVFQEFITHVEKIVRSQATFPNSHKDVGCWEGKVN